MAGRIVKFSFLALILALIAYVISQRATTEVEFSQD